MISAAERSSGRCCSSSFEPGLIALDAARRRSAASGGCRCPRRAARAAPLSTASASPGSPLRRRRASSGTSIFSRSSVPMNAAKSLTMSGSSVSRRKATSDIRRWWRIRNSTVSRASPASCSRSSTLRRHAHAFDRVIVVAPLADVVQQQRQHQQLGLRSSSPRTLRKRRRYGIVGRARCARDCESSAACARRPCTCGRSRAPPATRSPGTRGTRARAARSRASPRDAS